MKKVLAYIPIGVPTFDLDAANTLFNESINVLKDIYPDIVVPNEMLLSLDKVHDFIDELNPFAIIVQNITFANSEYICDIVRTHNVPVLLWTLKEPAIDGKRLRLNSLTGAFSAANALTYLGVPYIYTYGKPIDIKDELSKDIKVLELYNDLKNLNVLQIGHTPNGFGFGRALDLEMQRAFGSKLISIEARELIDIAKSYTDEEVLPYLEDAKKFIKDLDTIPTKNLYDFSRLYKSYKEYLVKNNIKVIASRCWPDFFTSFGTPVCSVLALLNDAGIASSCETDTYGALSMYIGQYLSNIPTFFGDPVSLDEENNTITFWHCGTGACSLARKDTGAMCGTHCNRHIGPTLEFGCMPSKEATIFRIARDDNGEFQFVYMKGEILDKPKQFYGTSLVFKPYNSAKDFVFDGVEMGLEPHYSIAFGDISEQIENLARILCIETIEF